MSIATEIPGFTLPPVFHWRHPQRLAGTLAAHTLKGTVGKHVLAFNARPTGFTDRDYRRATHDCYAQSGLPLSWTGVTDNSDVITIEGSAGTTALGSTTFVCTTTAGANSFTVPASITQPLPAGDPSASGGAFTVLVVLSSASRWYRRYLHRAASRGRIDRDGNIYQLGGSVGLADL